MIVLGQLPYAVVVERLVDLLGGVVALFEVATLVDTGNAGVQRKVAGGRIVIPVSVPVKAVETGITYSY